VFESRPNFPVTAHVYKPKGHDGEKLPVIVNANGHWPHKKSEPVVQERLIAQALHGYLAMIVDSAGSAFEEQARIERRGAGSHFDPKLRLGSTTADTIYVWDLMRALDYLETRPDADTSRAGITGTSGGGHATLSTFAADERFVCAAPVCYATSFLDGWENGCDCNHIPGYVQVGDRADVLAIRAPAPILVIGARTDDEFPPAGTQHTGEKLRAIWKLFGKEDQAGWLTFDGEHGYSKPMREASLGFFDRYLMGQGDGAPVPEPELHATDPEADELFCLPEPPAHQTTMREIAREGRGARDPRDLGRFRRAQRRRTGERAARAAHARRRHRHRARRWLTFQSEPGFLVPGAAAAAAELHRRRRPRRRGRQARRRERLRGAGAERGRHRDARDRRPRHGRARRARSQADGRTWAPRRRSRWAGTRRARRRCCSSSRRASPSSAAARLRRRPRSSPRTSSRASGLVVGLDVLQRWDDAFADDVSLAAVQPRAGYAPSLERLRALLRRPVEWYPRDSVKLDLAALLEASLRALTLSR
jgi:dienelactone hydrolase